MSTAVITFTGRGPDRIIREGGSQSWKLDKERVRLIDYLVCTQNKADPHDLGATEEHGSAFLVGRISGVSPSDDRDDAYKIEISEYARVHIPKVWGGWRNPVRYTTLEEIGIDPNALQFEPISASADRAGRAAGAEPRIAPLTIVEAKAGLSLTFGVPESAIEIIIRG